MTLSQLANFICAKVNQTEAEDVAICKSFLQRRHEMLWNEALWKDSLVQYTQILAPTGYVTTDTWLPTKGVLLCPAIIDRVLAARLDSRKLNVQRQEYYFRVDYDSFSKTGNPTEFVLLPPCVWEWETAQNLMVQFVNAGDLDSVLVADLLDSDGIGVTRSTVTLNENYKELGTTERIDSISGAARLGNLVIGKSGDCTVVNAVTVGLSTFDFYFTPINPGGDMTGYTKAATLASGQSMVLTPDAYISITPQNDPGVLVTSAVPYGGADFFGTITINEEFEFLRGDLAGITLPAADLAAKKHQRLRLLEIPLTETTIRVLGKRVCPTFSADTDEPSISGVSNCLLAFAHADMLQRERQYGKAQAVQQEAIALLEQLKALEMVQQAHNVSIQPGQGYVSEYQFNSGAYSPLTF